MGRLRAVRGVGDVTGHTDVDQLLQVVAGWLDGWYDDGGRSPELSVLTTDIAIDRGDVWLVLDALTRLGLIEPEAIDG
jgi:hypothetical protein